MTTPDEQIGLSLEEIARNLLRETVKGIVIETNLSDPALIVDPFGPGGEPGALDFVVKALQPKITFVLGAGLKPIVVAPAGEPSASKRETVQLAGEGIAVVGGIGLGYLLLKAFFGGKK